MITSPERSRPYVGVSGVTTPEMQDRLVAVSHEAELAAQGRLLALGVKAVHKTQYLDVENQYGADWYPVGAESFTNALRPAQDNDLTIGVAQTYLDAEHVGDAAYRNEFIERIAQRGRPWLQAVQFDMLPWHNDTQMLGFIEKTKTDFDVAILLQCHQFAMEELGPQGVVRRLGHQAAFVDYLLFDSSHGKGVRLDVSKLDAFLDEAHSSSQLDHIGMAVAGGLNAEAVREDLPSLLRKYPELSWDAEGRLHPVNNAKKRPLDMETTRAYLRASGDILRDSRSA